MNIVWFNWKDLDHPQAGGAEVVNEELAARLAAHGHTVTFLTSGFPKAAATTTRRGFTIIRTGSRFTNYFTAALYYIRHKSTLKPDLVIDECNTLPYFAGYYSGTKTVLFFHMLCRDIWYYEFPKPWSSLGFKLEPHYLKLLKPKKTVITVSHSTKRDLLRLGFPQANIHLISEGIQIQPVPSKSNITKYAEPTLLSFGAMRPMKRTLDQIEAFDIAKRANPKLKLIVAGDSSGEYGKQVLARISASPFKDSITVLGRVSQEKKIEVMQKSHLLMVTSVKEGWGLVVTEAASQFTPSIVYDVDGLRDAVKHGETGLIVPQNPQSLADAALELLRDDNLYITLQTTGWEWSKYLTFDQSYIDFTRAIGLKNL